MSQPFRYLKPLTLEQEAVIRAVTTRYEGIDAPFVKFEDEDCVTLLVPENIRRKSYYETAIESQKAAIHGLSNGAGAING